jgi:hypothetical protein
MPAEDFDRNAVYGIYGEYIHRLIFVAKRLYTETRLKDGDEMRDLAQTLQSVIDQASSVGPVYTFRNEPFPNELHFEGRVFHKTGKIGRDVNTGMASAEYASVQARVWRRTDGKVVPE